MKRSISCKIQDLYKNTIIVLLACIFLANSALPAKASSVVVDPKSSVTVEPGVRTMAEELVKRKGWDKLSNSELFIDSFARMASVNNVMTPKEVIEKLDDRLHKIEIITDIESTSSADSDGTMRIQQSQLLQGVIIHEASHILSMFNQQYPFCSKGAINIEDVGVGQSLNEGLTDLFSLRGDPEHSCADKVTYNYETNGSIVVWSNCCEGIGYGSTSGVDISFLFAAGSKEVERAYFIDGAGAEFKENFDRMNGEGKLDDIIKTIDECEVYRLASFVYPKNNKYRDELFNKTKGFITETVSILERRFKEVLYNEQAKEFLNDLKMYRDYAIKVSDPEFSKSIDERLSTLESKAEKAVAELPTAPSPTVTFDFHNANKVETVKIPFDSRISQPTNPERAGYTFEGWYKEAECKNKWNFTGSYVKSDITLYAKWEKDSSYEDPESGGEKAIAEGIIVILIKILKLLN